MACDADCQRLCVSTTFLSTVFITGLVLTIIGAIKVNSSNSIKWCNNIYPGFPERLQTIDEVVNVWFKIYNKEKTRIIEQDYLIITNTTIETQLHIWEYHKNSTFMKLYRSCVDMNDNTYYLLDFQVWTASIWQAIITFSIMAMLITGGVMLIFVCLPACEKCAKRISETRIFRGDYQREASVAMDEFNDV